MTTWDAVVVGAGPAGSIAARQLARAGVSVLLVDRQRFPRWKVCGACVGPGALATLDSVGLGDIVVRRGGTPLRWLALAAGDRRARVPLAGTMSLSRTALDAALVDAAKAEGVEFRDEVRVVVHGVDDQAVTLDQRRGGVSSRERALVVIDATGLGGGLGVRSAGKSSASGVAVRDVVAAGSRVGIGATLDDASYELPAGELRMVVGRLGYVGIVRVEDGSLNVAAAVDRRALSVGSPSDAVERILGEAGLPTLAGTVLHGWKGTPPLTHRPADVAQERLFRLGDAAGYVEPFTGEGMGWALGSGLAVVPFALEAIARWRDDLVRQWTAERRSCVGAQRCCRWLAAGLRRPVLVRTAVGILSRAPILAEPFVNLTARVPRQADPLRSVRVVRSSSRGVA